MTAQIIYFQKYKQSKQYPIILPESERQELIENGYDPDNADDVQAYWDDIDEG